MQTFLPYEDFLDSARVLDSKRLNKQIVECKQILLANLTGPRQYWNGLVWSPTRGLDYPTTRATPWFNHPATKIWRGYEGALCAYAIDCCEEALNRGIKVTLTSWFVNMMMRLPNTGNPPIISYEPFHTSHRSNLKRKDPKFYANFEEPDNLPYVWSLPS